ncbi:MAG: hypothetical protein MZV64_67810 [Ignavibacteriales bacterium]|nr:hypothetical protein [Ignavibacteriales bacterium]
MRHARWHGRRDRRSRWAGLPDRHHYGPRHAAHAAEALDGPVLPQRRRGVYGGSAVPDREHRRRRIARAHEGSRRAARPGRRCGRATGRHRQHRRPARLPRRAAVGHGEAPGVAAETRSGLIGGGPRRERSL